MKTRDAVLDYQYTAKDTETYKKDLDLVEPLSAIDIEVECTNGSAGNEDNFISDIVTKIEVVDGSEVLESLNMSQLEAMYFYKTGKSPAIFPSEWAEGGQRHAVSLLFGRYLWDREYAFDCKKFANPQLKITFNKAAIRAAGTTGFASGDNILLTTVAKVFVDVPAPAQFLMQKQIENFTSASSGEKRIELPLDYTYRMFLLRFWKEGSDIDEIISDIKFTCDTDKFIPINRKTKQLDAMALSQFGLFTCKHDIYRAHNADVRLIVNKEPNSVLFPGGQDDGIICVARWQWSSQLHTTLVLHDGSYVGTAKKLHIAERGHAPHATLPVPMGRLNEPSDWFVPTDYKKLELVLTQKTADAVCEIATEQVRPQ
jgi:hypothetical protein